jgi:hypothetical protein
MVFRVGDALQPLHRTVAERGQQGLLRAGMSSRHQDEPHSTQRHQAKQCAQDRGYDCVGPAPSRDGIARSMVLDAHRSWRTVKVTDRRTAADFALCMRELVDVHFPEAERIRVVLDNLSTHSLGALYQALPAAEGRRVLRRLEFHYTPKHASWLNMVEIEIGVLRSQCLDRRIESRERLIAEIAAWQRQRNQSGARINWMFSIEKARAKMGRAYPSIQRVIIPVQ